MAVSKGKTTSKAQSAPHFRPNAGSFKDFMNPELFGEGGKVDKTKDKVNFIVTVRPVHTKDGRERFAVRYYVDESSKSPEAVRTNSERHKAADGHIIPRAAANPSLTHDNFFMSKSQVEDLAEAAGPNHIADRAIPFTNKNGQTFENKHDVYGVTGNLHKVSQKDANGRAMWIPSIDPKKDKLGPTSNKYFMSVRDGKDVLDRNNEIAQAAQERDAALEKAFYEAHPDAKRPTWRKQNAQPKVAQTQAQAPAQTVPQQAAPVQAAAPAVVAPQAPAPATPAAALKAAPQAPAPAPATPAAALKAAAGAFQVPTVEPEPEGGDEPEL